MRPSYRPVPKRKSARPRPYLWIALAALSLLFLTSPIPVPQRFRAFASRGADTTSLPTAQIALDPESHAAAVLSLTPLVDPNARQIAWAASPTSSPIPPSPTSSETPTPEPSPTYAHPTRTPLPPTATLSPPLLIITSPPAPAITAVMELQATSAAPPTLMPSPSPAPPVQYQPAPAGPQAATGQALYIPTLMYHYVRYVDPNLDPLGYNLSVTPENLAAQLDWIAQQGYTTVTMDTLMRCRYGGSPEQPCPAKPIALTFDDGYEDAFTQAFPALQQRGMVATFYIITNFVGSPMYLNWDQIRIMRAAGMEIGAHTQNHPDLTILSIEQARDEIAGSKAIIEAQLGEPIRSFCYPAGRFSGNIVNLVKEAGFTNATTTMSDLPQSGDFMLPRIRVEGSYSLATFQSLVP
jgi:Predicted xylanase/chitin deacetylase